MTEDQNHNTPNDPISSGPPASPDPAPPADTGSALGTSLADEIGAPLGDAIGVPAPGDDPQAVAKTAEPEPPDAAGFWRGTGRRKAAVARVRIKPGDGAVKVQVSSKAYKSVEEYFPQLRDQNDVYAPLKETHTFGKLDVVARLDGGGTMGQAQAFRLGIARALKRYDPTLEGVLRERGFLTRDPRQVERKKYGQPGARRRFQFSKR